MHVDRRADLRHALDPVAFAAERLGIVVDDWQARFLRSQAARRIVLTSRQSGKSTTAAIAAVHRAIFFAESLVLVVSPSLRQSSLLFEKIAAHVSRLGLHTDLSEENRSSLTFANGSRVVSLPGGSEETIRGYSGVALVLEDEAAWVPDATFHAVTPMLAVSRGSLVLLSTPCGARGHLFDVWSRGGREWERYKITADDVPRIPRDFLEQERKLKGDRIWLQEYFCEFGDAVDAFFSADAVHGAISPDVEPLFFGSPS